jgi:hypothetical protein
MDEVVGGRTFDGGVVLVDEVALDELDGQAGLADAAAADDNELVLAKELGRVRGVMRRWRRGVGRPDWARGVGSLVVPEADGVGSVPWKPSRWRADAQSRRGRGGWSKGDGAVMERLRVRARWQTDCVER